MNFIEAFEIVNRYAKVVANKRGKTTFIRYSDIKETTDRVYDAFIIIIGHTVAFNTLSPEQLQHYLFISQIITNIVDDSTYEKAESSMNLLSNATAFDKIFRKKELEHAKNTFELCTDLVLHRYDTFHNSRNTIDFQVLLSELVRMKQNYVNNQDTLNFNDYFEQYLAKVYSYTTKKHYDNEDYMLFRPFKVLKNDVMSATGNDAIFYEKYKETIMTNA